MKALKIFLLLLPLTAVNAQVSIYRHREALETNYIITDSVHVNHAYIETLDAHSPIHVVAPLYLYYGAKGSASYISWFVTHHEDTIATVWGDTIGADTTDSVCIGDSVNGFVYFYGCLDKAVSRDDFGIFDNFGNFNVDTTTDAYFNFPCACGNMTSVVTSYQSKSNGTVNAAKGDTVFLYYWDSKSSAVTDSFILVAKDCDDPGKYCWYLYGCKKKWKRISNTRCINISDTLFQIFGNDTFYLREKRNY